MEIIDCKMRYAFLKKKKIFSVSFEVILTES